MSRHPYPFTTTNPAVAAAADSNGEACALLDECARSGQMDSGQMHRHAQAGELTLESTAALVRANHLRLMRLADIGATVTIEAYARRVPRTFGDSRPIYDFTEPDDEELPDTKARHEMVGDLADAAAHLLERGLIFRPWDDKPQLVAFVGRP